MRIWVDNNIEIFEPTNAVLDYCKNMLVLDNPDYKKLVRLGKYTGRTSKTISLYERRGKYLLLPFGCLYDLWRLHPYKKDWATTEHFQVVENQCLSYPNDLALFDYQKIALEEAIKKKNGVLVMPCGSGKTCVGLAIIAAKRCRALWLTHTGELLRQSKKRAESMFDLPKDAFGTITEGEVNVGTHITFATVQTMCRLDLEKYKDYWDIIIVDECQHCCGSPTRVTQFYKCLNSLSARYKIGLTATPKRADGLERAMFALLGGRIYTVKREDIPTCPIKVEAWRTPWQPDFLEITASDGIINYAALVESLISDEARLDFVCDVIKKKLGTGAMIVLANRVSYLQKMQERIGGKSICLSGAGNSKKVKRERAEALEKLNAGELDCVFATYQLSAEGLDVPQLRYVVFATPEKEETKVTQSVGRVGRIAEGKKIGIVIDFVDNGFFMYENWFKKRKTIYRKLGCEIEE